MNKAIGLLVGLSVLAVAAIPAAAVDVRYVNVVPGVNVQVYHPFPTSGRTFEVGVYNLAIDFNDGAGEVMTPAFCIDLKQSSTPNKVAYDLNSLDIAPLQGVSDYTPMGAGKADAIRELWGEHYAEIGTSNVNASAFQAAVWEIIYENGNSVSTPNAWTVSTGNVYIDNDTVEAVANAWLADIDGVGPVEQDLWSLTNYTTETKYQDYLIKLDFGTEPPVPEPVTLMTAVFSLVGLGSYVRRRTVA